MPRVTVGGRQAEHELQGVDGRGRYGNEGRQQPKEERRTDEESKEGRRPEELIRRC